jgi:hypothetical protein
MPTRNYALFTPLLAIGTGSGTLTLTDTNDDFFEIPDSTAGGQSALIDGSPVTINSVAAALGPQVVAVIIDGLTVNISLTPVRIIVETGIIDTTYIIYPELPPGAQIVSISLPLLFPNPVALPLCLAADTRVLSENGWRRAGDLEAGDRVMTLDDGLQPIRWIGRREIHFQNNALMQKFRPVVIEADAFGPGCPNRQLVVSPLHAILISSPYAELLFGDHEVFAAAKHLVDGARINVDLDCDKVSYCHFLLDHHSVLMADGALVESLFPGDLALNSVNPEARAEILAIYPDLQNASLPQNIRARHLLKKYEVQVLSDYMRQAAHADAPPARRRA